MGTLIVVILPIFIDIGNINFSHNLYIHVMQDAVVKTLVPDQWD